MLTRRGFDQEKRAPDNANETQSTGVPEEELPIAIRHWNFEACRQRCMFVYNQIAR